MAKRNWFIKGIAAILLFVMLFSLCFLGIGYKDNRQVLAETPKVHGNTGLRRPYVKNLEDLNRKIDDLSRKVDGLKPEKKSYAEEQVGNLMKSKELAGLAGQVTKVLLTRNPNDVNWKNTSLDLATGVIDLAASFIPFGGVVSAVAGPILGAFKDKEPTEIQLLCKYLDAQFELVNENIADLKDDVSDLSDQMDDSIDQIIQAVGQMEAGSRLYEFRNSGAGNFDYTLLKNYLYGKQDDLDSYKYAYYDKLVTAINDEASSEIIEEAYNELYQSLTTYKGERNDYVNILRQYMLPADKSETTIQRDYFDWLALKRDIVENGDDATCVEVEAVLFALDLYKTLLFAESCIAACDNYFATKIYEQYGENPSKYDKYESPYGVKISYGDLEIERESCLSEERNQEIIDQLVEDIIYILNMENSYVLSNESGELYAVNKSGEKGDSFGWVKAGQTIYLNNFTEENCDLFGFDSQKFVYKWSTGEENDGVLQVPENCASLSASLYYNGKQVYSIDFPIHSEETYDKVFNGGDGSEQDPYLITEPAQFMNIVMKGEDGERKFYKIINDLDFEGIKFDPLGDAKNPFEGELDGDGHTIKNLKINSKVNTGLFAKIGSNGEVKNLTLDGATIGGEQKNAKIIFCGGFAGQSEGVIYNCHLLNSTIRFERKNGDKYVTDSDPKAFETIVGGIAGKVFGEAESQISNCSLNNVDIKGSSYRLYGNQPKDFPNPHFYKNSDYKNIVNVGGVAGQVQGQARILNCVIGSACSISAYAQSQDVVGTIEKKDDPWDAYVSAYAAGIAPSVKNVESSIHNVYASPSVTLSAKTYAEDGINVAHTKNCVHKTYATVPGAYQMPEEVDLTAANAEYEVSYEIVKNELYNRLDEELGYYDMQIYRYGEERVKFTTTIYVWGCQECKANSGTALEFNDVPTSCTNCNHQFFVNEKGKRVTNIQYEEQVVDNLRLKVNGTEIDSTDYRVLGYYGLDTMSITGEQRVKVLFMTVINGVNELLSFDLPVYVKPIGVKEFKIEQLPKTEYDPDEPLTLQGGKFVLVMEDGSTQDVTGNVLLTSGSTQKFGKSKIIVTYNGMSAEYFINVKCEHNYVVQTPIAPTCEEGGYTQKICSKCEDIKTVEGSTVGKLNHVEEIRNAVYECKDGKTGYTGDKYCSLCDLLLEKGEPIDKVTHDYESVNGSTHRCKNGCKLYGSKREESHDFVTVENENAIVYTCVTCDFSGVVEKKASGKISRVVVGNSYGIYGRNDEIVVYVKIFENPGITGVSFRIRYDERLNYVRAERGEVLKEMQYFEATQKTGVIGFLAADANTSIENGDLLKLVFTLPSNAELLDEYEIFIDYSLDQFTDEQAEAIQLITFGGKITAVSHLPGDVNNDYAVDMIDTALIAKYISIVQSGNEEAFQAFLANQNYNFDEFYADVNLDGDVTLSDLVIMLQHFVGKNVQELTSNEFEVILNPNDGTTTDLETIEVQCYYQNGGNWVPSKYPDLPMPSRPGYIFKGWYTSLVGGTEIKEGDKVIYQADLLKQMLYAHWEEREYVIQYDINAPEDAKIDVGSMANSSFSYWTDKLLSKNAFVIQGYEFVGWATSPDGDAVYSDEDIIDIIEWSESPEEGLTLYAVWEPKTDIKYTVKHYQIDLTGTSWNLVDTEEFYGTTNSWVTPNVKDYLGFDAPDQETKQISADGSLIITYKYSRKTYTVYAEGTAGILSIDGTGSYDYGVSVTISATVDLGYSWDKWSGDIDSTENSYTFIMPACEVNIIANATLNTYQITYNLNKGSETGQALLAPTCSIETQDVQFGDSYQLATPTCDYYSFDGWYTAPSGGTKISDGIWATDENPTLYAHWQADSGITFISDVETFKTFTTATVNTVSGNYVLTCNLDLGEIKPIGSFTGVFDGYGFSLSYTITSGYSRRSGLIAELKGGTVKNLNVTGASVQYRVDARQNVFVGAIVGYMNNGTIENCNVKESTITGIAQEPSANKSALKIFAIAGGVVGKMEGSSLVKNCTTEYSTVYAASRRYQLYGASANNDLAAAYAGGICGECLSGLIEDSSVLNMENIKANAIFIVNFAGTQRPPVKVFCGGIVGNLADVNSVIECNANEEGLEAIYTLQNIVALGGSTASDNVSCCKGQIYGGRYIT